MKDERSVTYIGTLLSGWQVNEHPELYWPASYIGVWPRRFETRGALDGGS